LSTKIINHLPFKKIKSLIYKYKKKYSGRKLENAYVSIDRFESNWRTFIQRAEKLNSFILCVAISEPTKLVLSKSPLIKNAIIDYNNILYKLEKEYNNLFVIQPMTLDQSEKVSIDEFHVNSDGHQIIYNNLKPFLERCLL
jgi:lysophospholipase L1-like esterase